MKILVYGAGVIGCELAHRLCKAGNKVTVLARGKWKQDIDANGLVIRHYAQLHTSVNRVATIEKLEPDDVYDIIFVAVQYGQVEQLLPHLAANQSRSIVLVGNNMGAGETARALLPAKQLAFGFQGTGGRREGGRVISVHAGVGMTIGGLGAPLSAAFRSRIEEAFAGTRYRLTWENNMDAWLKCHMAFILPLAYLCYATNFHLRRTTIRQRNTAIEAAGEGYAVLKKLGIPIRPAGSDETLRQNRKKIQALLWVMAKTPLGRLAASDHCKNAGEEMMALDAAFEALRGRTSLPTPSWSSLRGEGAPHR